MFSRLAPALASPCLSAPQGAALPCLFFLGDRPGPLTVTRRFQLTGCSRRAVRAALALLVELRLASRYRSKRRRPPAYRLGPRDRDVPRAGPPPPAPLGTARFAER